MTTKRDRVARTMRAMFAAALMTGALGGCLPSEIGDDAGAGQSCGSRGQAQCGAGEYCNFPQSAQCGSFDAPGTCTDIPQACTREYAPVCGCDGTTYSNPCTAAAAGVSVLQRGECPAEEDAGSEQPGASCGGLIGGPCGAGEFCDYPIEAICGAADQPGNCRAIPDACTLILDPVCGCDDKTYGNPCEAARASTSVVKRGACEEADGGSSQDGGVGSFCGGFAGVQCADALYCSFPIATRCGSGDQAGSCQPKPEICTREYAPVCGCDGKTYGNACEAAAAGASILQRGECPSEDAGTPDSSCGGLIGRPCASGEFCDYPIEASCGAFDLPGSCRAIPDACTAIYDPVCGCDGKTYGNACEAASASASVTKRGACEEADGGSSQDAGVGTFCGGFAGVQCPASLYCAFPVATRCGSGDQSGTCETKPELCTLQYDPVCGCDGKTYGNACQAAGAGVSVAHDGEC